MEGSELSNELNNQGMSKDAVGPICFTIEVLMVLTNIWPILVVICYKKKREKTTTDVIILGLSITEILSVPLGLQVYFLQRWYGGEITHQIYHLISIWFQLASMCLITFMCLDYWYILRRVLNDQAISNNINKTRIIIVGLYTFTLCIAVLPISGLTPRRISNTGLSCRSWAILTSVNLKEHIFYIVFLILGYSNLIIVVSINVHVIYIIILLKKKYGSLSAIKRLNLSLTNNDGDYRSIVEMNIMTVVVTLIFYMAWLPVLVLISLLKAGMNVGGVAVLYALLSTTLTGLFNPILYAAFTKSYKQGYISLLRSGVRRLCCRSIFASRFESLDVMDDVQWQTSNVISNTNSDVEPTLDSNHITPEVNDIESPNLQPENNHFGNLSQIMSLNNMDVTYHGENQTHTIEDNTINETMPTMHLVRSKSIDRVNNVYETIYFDETIENDIICDARCDQSSHKLYESELSLLSSAVEDDEGDIEVRV